MTEVEYRPLNLHQERWDDVVDDNYYEPELPSLYTLMQSSTVCTISDSSTLTRDEASFLGS